MDNPIIFSPPMVRALLDGRKTMTRRMLKPLPALNVEAKYWEWRLCAWWDGPPYVPITDALVVDRLRVSVGDRLWVRETGPWRSPIYMPRRASRLTLEVTGVKVERVQEISGEDAIAEGIEPEQDLFEGRICYKNYDLMYSGSHLSPRASFSTLWDSIHGPGAWEANPWVYCIKFKTIKSNIDAMETT